MTQEALNDSITKLTLKGWQQKCNVIHQEERQSWTTAPHHNIHKKENHESIKREVEILAYINYQTI